MQIHVMYGELPRRRWVGELQRRLIDAMVSDLIGTTSQALSQRAPASIADVRTSPALVQFSESMRTQVVELKRFLSEQLYRHPVVLGKMDEAQRVLTDLFAHFQRHPGDLPEEHAERFEEQGMRALADYLAGMTDRFALREARRLGIAVEKLA